MKLASLPTYKNCCHTKYDVGETVWYLVKGTWKVMNKVNKFLPSYDRRSVIGGSAREITRAHSLSSVSWMTFCIEFKEAKRPKWRWCTIMNLNRITAVTPWITLGKRAIIILQLLINEPLQTMFSCLPNGQGNQPWSRCYFDPREA